MGFYIAKKYAPSLHGKVLKYDSFDDEIVFCPFILSRQFDIWSHRKTSKSLSSTEKIPKWPRIIRNQNFWTFWNQNIWTMLYFKLKDAWKSSGHLNVLTEICLTFLIFVIENNVSKEGFYYCILRDGLKTCLLKESFQS